MTDWRTLPQEFTLQVANDDIEFDAVKSNIILQQIVILKHNVGELEFWNVTMHWEKPFKAELFGAEAFSKKKLNR